MERMLYWHKFIKKGELLFFRLFPALLQHYERPAAEKHTKWAAALQNQINDFCAQRRLRSAWASAKSGQSSLFAWRKLDPQLHVPIERIGKTLIQKTWVFAGRTDHFVGFVIRWLKCLLWKSWWRSFQRAEWRLIQMWMRRLISHRKALLIVWI